MTQVAEVVDGVPLQTAAELLDLTVVDRVRSARVARQESAIFLAGAGKLLSTNMRGPAIWPDLTALRTAIST